MHSHMAFPATVASTCKGSLVHASPPMRLSIQRVSKLRGAIMCNAHTRTSTQRNVLLPAPADKQGMMAKDAHLTLFVLLSGDWLSGNDIVRTTNRKVWMGPTDSF